MCRVRRRSTGRKRPYSTSRVSATTDNPHMNTVEVSGQFLQNHGRFPRICSQEQSAGDDGIPVRVQLGPPLRRRQIRRIECHIDLGDHQ